MGRKNKIKTSLTLKSNKHIKQWGTTIKTKPRIIKNEANMEHVVKFVKEVINSLEIYAR